MRLRSSLLILTIGCAAIISLARVRTCTPSRTPPPEISTPDPGDSAVNRVASRSLAKDAICKEVRTKRLSLLEAAVVLGWLNQQPPAYPANCFRIHNIHFDQNLLAAAGESEIALLCLQILFRIQIQDGSEAETTLAVKEQYLQLCQTGWDIPLPRIAEPDCWKFLARATAINDRDRRGHDSKEALSVEGLSLIERSHR